MATAPRAVPKVVPKPAATAEAATAPPAGKSRQKILIIVLSVLLLAGAGAATWFFFFRHPPEAGAVKAAKPEAPKIPVFVVMEPFVVNLQSEGADQFLQVALTLQVGSNEQVDQFKLYMPQIRSRILTLLSSKRASEINTPEGKKKLITDVMSTLKKPFSSGGPAQEVVDVFFTSFVIQ
jgi:flagellar FliL protein